MSRRAQYRSQVARADYERCPDSRHRSGQDARAPTTRSQLPSRERAGCPRTDYAPTDADTLWHVPDLRWNPRRYIPHLAEPGSIQVVTFRTADSVPRSVIDQWKVELRTAPEATRKASLERHLETYLDAGHGDCILQVPAVAAIVAGAIVQFDGERYDLLAWCVMPNHVHAVVRIRSGHPLDRIVHSWKSFSATQANRSLGRTGTLWMADYHDRTIRDEQHLANALRYVNDNPVRAGLCKSAEDWPWSSASVQTGTG